jgi:TonB family protein
LAPGATGPSLPGADIVAPPSQANQDIEIAANPTPATAAATPPVRVVWTQTPSARRIAELYPAAAANNGTGGRVVLDCTVQASLEITCSVVSAPPATAGFDRAALRLAGSYRARATRSDGSNAVGTRTRVAVNFQPPAR